MTTLMTETTDDAM